LVKSGTDTGEEFAVNCPFCGDQRSRLLINHLWGTKSRTTGKTLLWLANCFNTGCLSDFQNRADLYEMVFGDDRAGPVNLDVDQEVEEKEEKPLEPADFPGLIIPLKQLIRPNIPHDAVDWCLARNYDPTELADIYDVHYCAISKFANDRATNRLVAPLFAEINGRREMVAWTARKLEDEQPGGKWEHSYTTIGRLFYGLDIASKYKTIVVTEGPGDAWAVGPQAVSVLGKTIQQEKVRMLRHLVESRASANDTTVVLMLDPAMDKVTKAKQGEHHMVKAERILRLYLPCKVVPVYLPEYSDPGSLDRRFIWACIRKAGLKHGVRITRETY
jgi:hypothetical protein